VFDRISHIGVVVRDLGEALAIWRDRLGFRVFDEQRFEAEGIRSVFLSVSGRPGEMAIELMEPLDPSDMGNPVARRLANRGEGFYHLAVVTANVAAAGETLERRGFPVIERPAVGDATQGRWLIHPKAASGVMVEGIEEWGETAP
jgi:methylmalonyl-CoA/ethylmalonyl-CoA epimerase